MSESGYGTSFEPHLPPTDEPSIQDLADAIIRAQGENMSGDASRVFEASWPCYSADTAYRCELKKMTVYGSGGPYLFYHLSVVEDMTRSPLVGITYQPYGNRMVEVGPDCTKVGNGRSVSELKGLMRQYLEEAAVPVEPHDTAKTTKRTFNDLVFGYFVDQDKLAGLFVAVRYAYSDSARVALREALGAYEATFDVPDGIDLPDGRMFNEQFLHKLIRRARNPDDPYKI